MIEIDLSELQKAKSKQQIRVKATATRKAHYREMEVGQEEVKKKPPRKDTGRIASLPEDIKKEILELRRVGDSGASIKESIEGMIDHSNVTNITSIVHTKTGDTTPTGRSFIDEGLIDRSGKLKITGQSLVDWAKARGVESKKKRRTVKTVAAEAKEVSEQQFKESNEKLARLQTENKDLKEQLERSQKSGADSNEIRSKLRNENYILREKLKVC